LIPILLLFSPAAFPSISKYNPNIPIKIEDGNHILQLFYSHEDGLDGFKIQIEDVKEPLTVKNNEIMLHLLKLDFENELSKAIAEAKEPFPEKSLVQSKSFGQSFNIKNEPPIGFYIPFGTFDKTNYCPVTVKIYKLENPIYGEYKLRELFGRKPIGELCSKDYCNKSGIGRKYKEFIRKLMNKPPNLLHHTFGEIFYSRYPNLCGIQILFGTYERINKGKLKFYLKEKGISAYSRIIDINMETLKDNQYEFIPFEQIADSKGKYYYFFVESDDSYPDNAITGYTSLDDYLPDSQLYINHKPFNDDLIFRPIYDFNSVKSSDPVFPEFKKPVCSIELEPASIKDNTFIFLDISLNQLTPGDYYMEINSPQTNMYDCVTLYSTYKNVYPEGSRFEDRAIKGGDLLFIPVFPHESVLHQKILTSKCTIDGENSKCLKFKFPKIENSTNKTFGFYLELPPETSDSIEFKTKPVSKHDENYLFSGQYSTGRSFMFSPYYADLAFFQKIERFYNQIQIDKPNVFSKNFYMLLTGIFILSTFTILISIVFLFKK